jgi:hypothetical protein
LENESYARNHYLNLKIRWFETDDKEVLDAYQSNMKEDQILALGFVEVSDISNHMDE